MSKWDKIAFSGSKFVENFCDRMEITGGVLEIPKYNVVKHQMNVFVFRFPAS
jgi:hypothetical protein